MIDTTLAKSTQTTRPCSTLFTALRKLQQLAENQEQVSPPAQSQQDPVLFTIPAAVLDSPAPAESAVTLPKPRLCQDSQALKSKKETERRKFPRRISHCTVALDILANETHDSTFRQAWRLHSSKIKGHLADISRNGVAMMLGRQLSMQKVVCLRITNPIFDHSLIVEGKIIRQQLISDDHWRVMCQFDKPLDYEQIEFLGSHLFTP